MSIQAARMHLKKYNAQERIIEFDTSSATVELAARALHLEGARIAKTLSFKQGEGAILVVMAGDRKVDNRKFKDTFGIKAKMLSPEETSTLVGHQVGGVCPFGVKEGVKIYLDDSLKRFETVYPAAGSSNSAIEVTLAELECFSETTTWVDVSKGNE